MDIRDEIVNAVLKEIVGPSPNPNYIDSETGEEVLLAKIHGSPKSRYGAGILYPQATVNNEECDSGEGLAFKFDTDFEGDKKIEESSSIRTPHGELNFEEPVGLANQYLPSAMGFTLRLNGKEKNDKIKLEFTSSQYIKKKDKKAVKRVSIDSEIENIITKDGELLSDYWVRNPLKIESLELNINSIFEFNNVSYKKVLKKYSNDKDWLTLQIYNRSTYKDKEEGCYTFTFVLINSIVSLGTDDSINSNYILYQNELKLITDNNNLIIPYQERVASTDTEEERELNLLYRKKRIFAIGHGVAVNWTTTNEDIGNERVTAVKTSVLPVYEIPQVAPSGNVELSMFELSDLSSWQSGKESLKKLVSEYRKWIDKIEYDANFSNELKDYRDAAKINVDKCKNSLSRIENGIKILCNQSDNSNILKCFLWMNEAMIWQQQRSKVKQRKWRKTGDSNNVRYNLDPINDSHDEIFQTLKEFHDISKFNGRWRPFQLAFILMNIESIINEESKEREIIDLIWFPTGGGKTEAYLGLAAFTIFYRRIQGKDKSNWSFYEGTTVLMRYTLRLLTTQQYERAASLICACDLIRKKNLKYLGSEPISIGLWVGGGSTPNDNINARAQFNQLVDKKESASAAYNFIVMKCPCCGAQIGKLDQPSVNIKIKGLKKEDGSNGKIVFQCDNNKCEYSSTPLPLQIVDDYIYENPPTLLLGTVDKFAMITWKSESGKIFGFREKGNNWFRIKPPELIIQDELHLIAGPLGTMVGLYETMVQTLCNNYKLNEAPFIIDSNNLFFPAKIIASSATISRAFEQVKSLYGIDKKEKLHIFPSQGLEFGNTWFSEEKSIFEKDENGNTKFPGRKYVGILTSGYPSAQTAIERTYSTILQRVKELENEKGIDFYWTLLAYFNSIRELGGASSLVYGDVKERLSQIQNRDLINKSHKRYINKTEELTSRISSGEIPEVLKKLEVEYKSASNNAIDICLSTNMVATGVDISRLGLMFIHGQPKTTAEYIQASSRVGRKLPDGPGIVFSLYSPSKPRDKSQYEQFQGYHSRIYANVEPTSVTPFSINAREKALHAILVGLIRHFSTGSLRHSPEIVSEEFEKLVSIFKDLIIKRCENIDKNEVENTRRLIEKRVHFWKLGFQYYGDAGNYKILQNEGVFPLLYASGSEVREEIIRNNRSLATPTSMRGVDSESVINLYTNKVNNGKE
jgi:hypothetical protein